MVPVEAQACGTPVVALARGGAVETVEDGVTGVLVHDDSAHGFADALTRLLALTLDPVDHPGERGTLLPRAVHDGVRGGGRRRNRGTRARAMMRRYNRLLVLFYVICDALLGMAAFALAYVVRFRILDEIIPITKGIPPFSQYLTMMPFIGLIVPIAFQVQGTVPAAPRAIAGR